MRMRSRRMPEVPKLMGVDCPGGRDEGDLGDMIPLYFCTLTDAL